MTDVQRQATFDRVATHLMTQGHKALLPDHMQIKRSDGKYSNICAYRTPSGDTCAAGCLIPEEQYRPELEQTDLCDVIPQVPALQEHDKDLLARLQEVHDCWDAEDWKDGLRRVADEFFLTPDNVPALAEASDA